MMMPGMGSAPDADVPTVVQAFRHELLRQGIAVLTVAALLLLAWNLVRGNVHRRGARPGPEPGAPSPHGGLPEPTARRLVRWAFGGLWLVSGLLLVQPAVPLGVPVTVFAPSASGADPWVQRIVDAAAGVWERHPTTVAASVVWIEIALGLLLVLAPRGRWSRAAGAASCLWGLVLWVAVEGFGGLASPGTSLLFGAPGPGLVFAAAGLLVALPDRAWVGPRLGRAVTGAVGVVLLGAALLQLWPGRGFWPAPGTPGTLATMIQRMAATPQPREVASLLRSAAAIVVAHGTLVNLLVVAVLAVVGVALTTGRHVHGAVVALGTFGCLVWILVDDVGVFGGTGSGLNLMVPLTVLAAAGRLAAVDRVDLGVDVGVGVGGRERTPAEVRPFAGWWTTPRVAGRLAAAVGATAVLVIGVVPLVVAASSPTPDPILTEAVNGPPTFVLTDQHGRTVSLASLRGDVVALTFLDPVCTTDCPFLAQEFRLASDLLAADRSRVRFVAIVANPVYRSVADVDAFDRQEGMADVPNWLFLTGSRATLTKVWYAYGITAAIVPAGGMVLHQDVIVVIDADGQDRRILEADPGAADATSLQSAAGLVVSEISGLLHR
jgi:cytochrome oxidase Cu insertion factor (SCO1/SenC/PrrC family)